MQFKRKLSESLTQFIWYVKWIHIKYHCKGSMNESSCISRLEIRSWHFISISDIVRKGEKWVYEKASNITENRWRWERGLRAYRAKLAANSYVTAWKNVGSELMMVDLPVNCNQEHRKKECGKSVQRVYVLFVSHARQPTAEWKWIYGCNLPARFSRASHVFFTIVLNNSGKCIGAQVRSVAGS